MRTLFAKQHLGIATRHLGWVALGFFGMLLVLGLVLARVGAQRILDAARWYGTWAAGEQSIAWDGQITLERVEFTPHGSKAEGAISAARVVIQVGGPVWLMRAAMHRTPADRLERRRKELESNGSLAQGEVPWVVPAAAPLVLVAEDVRIGPRAAPARWLPWLDPSNGVLFASLGCGEAADVSSAIASRAGDSGRLDLRMSLEQHPEVAKVSSAFTFGGISTAVWEAEFLPPSKHGLLASDWRQWQLVEQKWTLRDRGFVRARNRECARRLEVPRPQFVARHALAVKRRMAAWNMALPEPLEHAYRDHASLGGEIVFESRPRQPLRLGEYQLMSRSQRIGALDADITVAGRRLPLLLEFLPESDPASVIAASASPPGKLAGLDVLAPARAAGARPVESREPVRSPSASRRAAAVRPVEATAAGLPVRKPSTAIAASAVADAAPRTVDPVVDAALPVATTPKKPLTAVRAPSAGLPSSGRYEGLVGRRVTVTTTLGTARTGKMRNANAVAITLEMQTSGGPIQLRIPAEQIVRVRTVL